MPDPKGTELEESKDARGRADKDGGKRPPWWAFGALLYFAIVLLAFFGWSVRSYRLIFLEALLGVAAFSVGGLIGFLFGLPRVPSLEGREPRDTKKAEDAGEADVGPDKPGVRSPYQPSTNLEQIADWLTKILIGVGLVEFREVAELLSDTGKLVSEGLVPAPPGAGILTQAVLVAFAVLGFLLSFLWTRLYYGGIQTRVDWEVSRIGSELKEVKREVKQNRKVQLQNAPAPEKGRTPLSSAKDDSASPEGSWPEDVRKKVERFRLAEVSWYSNPTREIFGNVPSEANGRRLEGNVEADLGEALALSIRVRRVGGEPLQGVATFLLHPTFLDRIRTVPVHEDVAQTMFNAGGWFTVVVIADQGRTILGYDLKSIANVPAWFKTR